MDLKLQSDDYSVRFFDNFDEAAKSFEKKLITLQANSKWPALTYWQTSKCITPAQKYYFLQMENSQSSKMFQAIIHTEISRISFFKTGIVKRCSIQASRHGDDYKIFIKILKSLCKSHTDLMKLKIQFYLNGNEELLQSKEVCSGFGFSECKSTTYRSTRVIDLTKHPDDLLKGISPRKRTQLRKKPENFRIDKIADTSLIPQLQSALNDSFKRSHGDIYQADFTPYFSDEQNTVGIGFYQARNKNSIKAFVMGMNHNGVCEYTYGGSTNDEELRKHPFNLLLMWELMEEARKLGCHTFDMGGITDESETDPLANVSRFKRGFPGTDINISLELNTDLNTAKATVYNILSGLSQKLRRLK